MTPTQFEQLQTLFEEAVNLTPDERARYLENAGVDDEMREALERLLKVSGSEGGVVTGVVFQALNAASGAGTDVKDGTRLGGYRIVRHLATGGMAHVYLAERADDEFQKQVAIKVIQSGLGCEGFEARFRLERQILASLEHPNCCRLLDGGVTPEGRPYLVMEYVEGQNLTEYAGTHSLDVRRKLSLFGQLCRAVEYAHSNLVIHRDIKPTNVMVTTQGIVKLMDFGIAKLLDGSSTGELTTSLDRMATPDYASPEQLRGEAITTASDIYSLGIVLLELLTGRKKKGEGSPLPRELQAIVQKATHLDVVRRYTSVGQFYEDIGRYRDGYPVLAKSDGWGYRAWKFVRRNRVASAAVSLAVVALVGGLLATVREQRRTKLRFDEVRNLATVFLFEFDASIRDLPGATDARRKLVSRALRALETLTRDSQGDVSLQEDLAGAYHSVSGIQWATGRPHLGDKPGAIRSLQSELAIRERIAGNAPRNSKNLLALGNAYGALNVAYGLTDPKAASLYSDKAGVVFSDLEKRFPQDKDVMAAVATNYARKGLDLHKVGKLQEALAAHQRAVALMEPILQRMPGNPEMGRLLGWFHIYVGDVRGGGGAELHLGDRKGAIGEMQKAVVLFEDIKRQRPESGVASRDLRAAMGRVAGTQEMMGNFEEAIRIRVGLLEQVDALQRADPASSESARDAATSHASLGLNYKKAGRLADAERELVQAGAMDRERMKRFPRETAAVLDLAHAEHVLGDVYRAKGQRVEAARVLRESLAHRVDFLKANPGDFRLQWRQAKGHQALGEVLEEMPDWAGARAAYEEALRIFTELDKNGNLNPDDKKTPGELAGKIRRLEGSGR